VPDLAAALSPPGPGVDVAVGLIVAAAGAAAVARGRTPWLLVAGALWLAGDAWDPLVYAHRGPLAQLAPLPLPLTALVWIDGLVPALARAPWPTLLGSVAVLAAVAARRRWWALAGTAAVAGPLAWDAVARLTGSYAGAPAAWAYDAGVVAVAFATALRPSPATTAELVIDLGAHPRALRAALARALGDPTLEVAYRDGDAWVDEAGRAVAPAPPGRGVRAVDDEVSVRFDPAALRDPELAATVDAALRLALANARLEAEVAARVREVEASRRRLVEAAGEERRRLREQLDAGAGRELAAAGDALAALPGAAPLCAELEEAVADLERFALGIHPPTLTGRGLRAALLELAAGSPLRVGVAVAEGRFPAPVELVAFFVCSECLTNVTKYAAAERAGITVTATGGTLRVRVADDGRGGADPAGGTGLRGLADRVEALGGRLRVDSPPARGTLVEAELPLGAPVVTETVPAVAA
jgi:signal transduction histidine kinase